MARVLIVCECSGALRRAFRSRGHDAYSVDLKPAEDGSECHHTGDALAYLDSFADGFWDLVIMHPPCTRFSSSGQWYVQRKPAAKLEQDEALAFTLKLWELAKRKGKRIVMENPIGILPRWFGPAWQIIQPHWFGDDASKATCLWVWYPRGIYALPMLKPTDPVPPRLVVKDGKTYKRWGNQTDSGQNKLGPSENRATERSRTYDGIANAIADQWGVLL